MRRRKEAETLELELPRENISGVRDKAIVYAVTKGKHAMARTSFELFQGDINEFIENNTSYSGHTLLDLVYSRGDGPMLKILVNAKVDVNLKNAHGLSPIHGVMIGKQDEMVLQLLKYGAQVEREWLEKEKCSEVAGEIIKNLDVPMLGTSENWESMIGPEDVFLDFNGG